MAVVIATWNVLASAYVRRSFYPNTPDDVLDKRWRIPALVDAAQGLQADLLCLQEVEREVFDALRRRLEPAGYTGSLRLKKQNKPDGCATFFRNECFEFVDEREIVYPNCAGHVAQVLRLRRQGDVWTALNTHWRWGEPFATLQSRTTLAELGSDPDALQILCGDLNLTPDSNEVSSLRQAGFEYAHHGLPGVASCNSNGQAKLIDYLLYRGPFQVEPVASDDIDDRTPLPSRTHPSDHVPLLASFTVEKRSTDRNSM